MDHFNYNSSKLAQRRSMEDISSFQEQMVEVTVTASNRKINVYRGYQND